MVQLKMNANQANMSLDTLFDISGKQRLSRPRIFFLLTLLGFCLLVPVVSAQDLRDLLPEPVSPQVAPPPAAEAKPPAGEVPAPADETVLVEALRGLIFVTSADQVQSRPEIPVDGIDASRVPLLAAPEARVILEKYLGQPVSMAALNRLVIDLYKYYALTDTPFVFISLPEQDITAGVVQLEVTEGRVGEIRIEGARYFSENIYRSAMRTTPGEPIRKSVLTQDTEWINRNPFRAGDFFLGPGRETGASDLIFRVNERLPLRVYGSYNNAGTKTTGKNRLETGFNWGNAFGLGHQLNYQFTTNTEFEDYAAHSGSYLIPLPWRDVLTLSGVYSRIHSRLPDPFNQDGRSSQFSLQYDSDLPAWGRYQHGLAGLFDSKISDNNMEFSDIPVTDNKFHILQWSLIYNGRLPDALGQTAFTGRLTYSPGDLTHRNQDKYFALSRAMAEADYTYGNLQLTRSLLLPAGFGLSVSATAQLADGNLLGNEQVVFSGSRGVRGYEENDVCADTGYILKAELLLPEFSFYRLVRQGLKPVDLFRPYLFADYGAAGNVDLLPEEDPATILKSAGLGCRYNVDRYFSLEFGYGWQLKAREGRDRGSGGHVSAMLSY